MAIRESAGVPLPSPEIPYYEQMTSAQIAQDVHAGVVMDRVQSMNQTR